MAKTPQVLKDICFLLDKKHAKNICAIDVSQLPAISDFFVIASAKSSTHLGALEKYLKDFCRERGIFIRKPIEGRLSSKWMIVDVGFAVIHLLNDEARAHYNLEGLWSEGRRVALKKKKITKKSTKKK
ncbi:ribosome silencing factor [Elusimicrobiota bacterium]